MNLFENISSLFKKQKQKINVRNFAGAQVTRLTSDWNNIASSIDSDIRTGGRALRNRARDLEKNNAVAKRVIDLLVTNIIGAYGFTLEMNAGEYGYVVNNKGERVYDFVKDKIANQIILSNFSDWANDCSVNGRYSFLEVQQILYRYLVRDGEFICKKIIDKKNKWGYKLQIIPPEILDENYNGVSENGNVIIMGIEIDKNRKPLNYYFANYKPEIISVFGIETFGTERIKVSADEVIHGYSSYYSNQTRGYSWLAPVMLNLRMLGEYETSAVTNARAGSTKLGFIQKTPDATQQQFEGNGTDASGNRIFDIQPLGIYELNPGESFHSFDTKYPDSEFSPFVKAIYRSISIGVGLDYMSLSGDLSEANYSSMRSGALETRRSYRMRQEQFIKMFLNENFSSWLKINLLKGNFKYFNDKELSIAKYENYNRPIWHGLSWEWVDPLRDVNAAVQEISAGLSSPQEKIAERGGNMEEVYKQIAEANELAKSYGIVLESQKLTLENQKVEKILNEK